MCHFWGSIVSNGLASTDIFVIQNLGRVCGFMGYLAVACFFFLSGYGLMVQYQKKGNDYLKGFLLKRVVPLYIVCAIFILFYWGASVALGESVGLSTVAQSFFFGKTIISKGWYFQAILIWYVLFYLSFRFLKKESRKIVLLFVSFVLYIALCLIMRLESTWYEGCFCVVLGVVWAKNKSKIDDILSKRYALCLLFVFILFTVTFVFGNTSILDRNLQIVFKCVSASAFSILIVMLLRVLKVNFAVTRFLGKISLEIYILHGFFLSFFFSKYISIKNPLLYGALVIASTIAVAVIIHPAISKILTFGKIGLERRSLKK